MRRFHQYIMNNWHVLTLVLIVSISLFFRIVNLDKLVLVHDEMSIAYNAFSILNTGQDEWGEKYPLVFKAFGDYKLPAYIYLTVISFVMFGVNDLALKIPSLLAGILIIIASYWLTYVLTNKRLASLLASIVVAISPWPIHLSRLAIESHLATAFFLFGVLAAVKIIQNPNAKKIWVWVLGISLAGAVYSYVAFRMLVPLFGLVVGVIIWKYKLPRKSFLLAVLIFCLLVLPLLTQVLSPAGTARFNQVSIFSDQGVTMTVNEQRANCFIVDPRLSLLCKLLFNKPLTYLEKILSHHAHFILPTFLFFDGGGSDLVYTSMPGWGEFIWILYPFYVIGMVFIWRKRAQPTWLMFMIVWILAVIPSSLAGPPQVIRGAALMPFAAIIIGMGLFASWKWVSKKTHGKSIAMFFLVATLIITARFLVSYWVIYPVQYSWRSYPLPKQAVIDVLEISDNYQRIYFHQHFPDAHIALAWYGQLNPEWYRQVVVFPEPDQAGFQHPTKLDKYEFGDLEPRDIICTQQLSDTKTLYIAGSGDQIPPQLAIKYYDPTTVHVVAQVIDLNEWQTVLRDTNKLAIFCK